MRKQGPLEMENHICPVETCNFTGFENLYTLLLHTPAVQGYVMVEMTNNSNQLHSQCMSYDTSQL